MSKLNEEWRHDKKIMSKWLLIYLFQKKKLMNENIFILTKVISNNLANINTS